MVAEQLGGYRPSSGAALHYLERMDSESSALGTAVVALIERGLDVSEAEFDALALRLFAYQYDRNPVYRAFCLNRGIHPNQVASWRDIPALPVAAFKQAAVTCFPAADAAATYVSSGTTGTRRSSHYLPTLAWYDASLLRSFEAALLPDRPPAMRMALLALPPDIAVYSSLSHMLDAIRQCYGTFESQFFLDPSGLQANALGHTLAAAQRSRQPIALLGTTLAFVYFLDFCRAFNSSFALPPGSRLMDTGGNKGLSRVIPRAEVLLDYERLLGIPSAYVVNEYGMSEMGSQFYDTSLREHLAGTPGHRRKLAPPWVRTLVIDPETMQPARPGQPGLLRHCDLANIGSCFALQTEDLGVQVDDGFEIIGRASGAEARGCSISVDELLSTHGSH